jgi:outer membrane receptor protein involved in Fe transport
MVGPMNVRAYDLDRGETRRAVLRVSVPLGTTVAQASVRAFGTSYRDPAAPVNDFRAASTSADVELARAVGVLSVRAGAGADRATGGSIAGADRLRAFAAAANVLEARAWRVSSAVRVDAIGDAGVQLSPSVGVERPLGASVAVFARAAQAFRAPTLYDLYFAGAQRLVARELRPERVTLDGELGARAALGVLRGAASVFDRRTRDAIVWFPGNFGWSASNVGRERVVGAEARAEATFDAGSVSAWGSLYRARLDADGLTIPTPYVPAAAGGAVATLRAGAASFTGTLQATGRRAYGSGPVSRTYELPGVALAGAHATYAFSLARVPARLTAGVENIGDVEWQSVRAYPAAGRSWSASLTLQP